MATNKGVETYDNKEQVQEPTTAYASMTKAQLIQLAQENTARIAEQNAKLATAKITKTTSEYFCNAKNENIAYKNLSETKRHFENEHETVLKAECDRLGVEALTSKQFHQLLSSKY